MSLRISQWVFLGLYCEISLTKHPNLSFTLLEDLTPTYYYKPASNYISP
jgi:hypothetical protein